ncbi:MAG: RNA polymerase sigma factor RpoD/SigA [Fusobacteriaceae bacterium]|nr:RNA polymerase sigma factor RpoD/SigA [Fusobacteriaceae bacterium]
MNISNYLKDISHYPLLKKNEEIFYSLKAKEGDKDAQDKLVTSNLRLVVNIAKKYSNLGVPLLDLIQEGNIGLINACKKFNPDLDVRFSTYATFWIKQSILRHISSNKGLIRFPLYIHDNISKINKFVGEYKSLNSCYPSNLEIAKNLDLKLVDIERYREISSSRFSSFENLIGDGIDLHNVLSSNENIEDNFISNDTNEKLLEKLNILTPIEKNVIINRYGLFNFPPLTLGILADSLDISKERVRQIQARAIEKLKARLL